MKLIFHKQQEYTNEDQLMHQIDQFTEPAEPIHKAIQVDIRKPCRSKAIQVNHEPRSSKFINVGTQTDSQPRNGMNCICFRINFVDCYCLCM